VKGDRGLTIERMVKLGRIARSGFYRFEDTNPGPDPDMDLRDAIQKIAVEWPATDGRAFPKSCGDANGRRSPASTG